MIEELRASRQRLVAAQDAERRRLEVAVRDDGRGFDTRTTSSGTGLQGMADRLDAIGGEVRIESEPGSGTTVTVSVPTTGST